MGGGPQQLRHRECLSRPQHGGVARFGERLDMKDRVVFDQAALGGVEIDRLGHFVGEHRETCALRNDGSHVRKLVTEPLCRPSMSRLRDGTSATSQRSDQSSGLWWWGIVKKSIASSWMHISTPTRSHG